MDKYNARQKALERLMAIYEEYYRDVTPLETSQIDPLPDQTQLIPQTTPLSTPRTKKTSSDQTTDGTLSSRRDQDTRGLTTDRIHLRQGQTEEKFLTTLKVSRPSTYTVIESMTHTITPTSSPTHLVRATSAVSEPSGPDNQEECLH